jgi:hypothetical protein
MVRVLLGLAEVPPADAADALAIAVTHLQDSAILRAAQPMPEALRAALAAGSSARRRRLHIRKASPV